MKTQTSFRRFAFAGAVLFAVLCARGADMSSLKHSDKSFFELAAKAGTEEVAISQIVLLHFTDPQIKDFAQMMVTDHTGANQELSALAARKGVSLPDKQPDTAKWEKKKAKGYDEAYIKEMVKDHDEAVELFTKAANKAEDPDVRAFAAKVLPTVQAHFEKAKALKKSVD